MKRIYNHIQNYDDNEIQQILLSGDYDELMLLPLSIGEYYPDWKKAQDICVKLINYDNSAIRANASLGLAYIARTKGKLEKHLVKPLLLRELRENTEYQGRIIDAIEDINIFLKWNIAKKHIDKIQE